MKKLIILNVLVLVTMLVYGQVEKHARLNFYSSYVFDDRFDSYYSSTSYYEGKLKGGYQWGLGLEYAINPAYGVELLYLNQKTTAPTTYQDGGVGGVKTREFDMGMNYIMLGGLRHATSSNGKIEGYGGMLLGVAIINVDNPEPNGNSGSVTKFAWGLRLGANIWANEKIGIKVQTQLLSVTQAMGGGVYFGTGGVGAGVSSYSTIYQFGLGGGLTFRLGGGQ